MRNYHALKTLIAMVMVTTALAMTACSNEDDYTKAAYKSLTSAAIAYDTGMAVAADAYKKDLIGEEAKKTLIESANKFYTSYMLAAKALETAVEAADNSEGTKERIVALIAAMWRDYGEYKTLTESMLKEYNYTLPAVDK